MLFSYNWIQSYFKEKLPAPEKLAEGLSLRSFETEVQKKNSVKDIFLEIKVLPNRAPDCFCYNGIAKEVSLVIGKKVNLPPVKTAVNSKYRTKDYAVLDVVRLDLCPRYMGLLVKGVSIKQSPKWLSDRLVSVGQKTINNIVDAMNYVMLETGQPLHAFDLAKIADKKIIVRNAKNGEEIETLDGKKVKLNPSVLLIADEKDPLAIAGIKGGRKAEITKGTEDIIIEAAVFSPVNIRDTSKTINIKTDASIRFEHDISLRLPETAIMRAAALVRELSGGQIAVSALDFCAQKIVSRSVLFTAGDIEKNLGVKISDTEIRKNLIALGFAVEKKKDFYSVKSPVERTDINIKADIIEEIARLYGYEKILSAMPEEIILPVERNNEYFYGKIIRNILSGMGFSEVYNYSFRDSGGEILKIANPFSADRAYLRENLADGLRETVAMNLKNFETVKVFEIGKIFKGIGGSGVGEETKIAGAIGFKNGSRQEKNIFFELKGSVTFILEKLNISDLWFDDDGNGGAKIISAGKELGFISAGVFEIDLNEVINSAVEDTRYKPISRFPSVVRDLSIFVQPDTRVAEVLNVIETAGGELITDIDLFDIYEPEEEERKSFSFRLIFQSPDKTLSDTEVNSVMAKIIKSLESNNLWEVRKQ